MSLSRCALTALFASIFLLAVFQIFAAVPSFALEQPGEELPQLDLTSKLGSSIDLDLQFTQSDGRRVTLRELTMPNRPFIIVPVYYECPRLCGLLLNGVTALFNNLGFRLGTDLTLITVSFNSQEGVELAAKRASKYRTLLTSNAGDPNAWHFLVGEQPQINRLMQQIGFVFKPDGGEFAHTALLTLLTPRGEISQYFTGVEFPAWDVKLALVEASKGAIGSPIDHALLFCFRFDPLQGRYTWAVSGLLRLGGALTLLFLGFVIVSLLRREKRLQRQV